MPDPQLAGSTVGLGLATGKRLVELFELAGRAQGK